GQRLLGRLHSDVELSPRFRSRPHDHHRMTTKGIAMTNHPSDPYGQSDSTPSDGFEDPSPYAPAPEPAEHATYGIAASPESTAPSTGEPTTSSSSNEPKKRRRWVVPVITGVLAFSIGAVAGSGGGEDTGAASAEAAAQVS